MRDDLERLSVPCAGADPLRRRREDLLARAILDAGRSVIREPAGHPDRGRNVETEWLGSEPSAPCVLVVARYDQDEISRLGMFLAVMRALGPARFRRTLRFVAFAGPGQPRPGAPPEADSMSLQGALAHAVVWMGRLGLERERTRGIVLTGPSRARPLLRVAVRAFGRASRIPVRALALPSFWPATASLRTALPTGWSVLTATDHGPWQNGPRRDPDVDRMVAAVPGLIAALQALAASSP